MNFYRSKTLDYTLIVDEIENEWFRALSCEPHRHHILATWDTGFGLQLEM